MDKIVMIALVTESLWETIKMLKSPKGINFNRVGVTLLGILVALATGLDIFDIAGAQIKIPYLGSILTGFLISRGSNFIHDIFGSMGQMYQTQKNGSTPSKTQK